MKKLNCHGKSDPKEGTNGAKGEVETSADESVLPGLRKQRMTVKISCGGAL